MNQSETVQGPGVRLRAMKQRVFQILAGLTVLTLLAAPGWAQERYDRVLENQAQAPEPDEAPAEPKVVRSSLLIALAETIGGAHYLRLTCEGRDPSTGATAWLSCWSLRRASVIACATR